MISSPIIEHKLCKDGKKIYKKLINLCGENYKNISKIYLDNNEYELLLKSIPFHRRYDYFDRFYLNGKSIERRKND